ncbi:DNA ligase [Pseudoalteromonas phage PH357]|nr:DNA ligase [Pseudoalteromonas phage PH357]
MNKYLYKIDNKDKVRVWKAWNVEDNVYVEHGILDGKLQQSVYVAEPKNIGKVNETTGTTQAEIEVKALYEDQTTNQHYRNSVEEAQKVKDANLIPRKILNYKDGWKKLPEKCITSIKLNGSRACIIDGQLYSKIGRPEEVKHDKIREGIELADKLGFSNLDCEVYADGLSLQRIRSAWLKPIKTAKEVCDIANKRFNLKGSSRLKCVVEAIKLLGHDPNEDTKLIKLYVFDIPSKDERGYEERLEEVESFRSLVDSNPALKEVFDFCVYSWTYSHQRRVDKLKSVHLNGYEGLVHYDPKGVYEFGKRSSNTQKAKPRLDSEAFVLDVTKDKSGQGVLLLKANDAMENVEFKAKMKGDAESRSYEKQLQYVGKWVNYQYEELSDNGIPTKPVVIGERLCDDSGNPLE